MGISPEIIVELIGDVDGVNPDFITPTVYISGTLRAIVNGVVYDSSHPYYGWTEIDNTSIQMVTPPEAGSRMQAFIREAEPVGSPFSPEEV